MPLFDHLREVLAGHGHEARSGECDRALRHRLGDREAEIVAALGRVGQLLGGALEEGEDLVQRALVELWSEPPAQRRRISRPVQMFASVARDAGDREVAHLRPDRDRLSGVGEGGDPAVPALDEGQPAAVGRDSHLGGHLAPGVLTLAAPAAGVGLAVSIADRDAAKSAIVPVFGLDEEDTVRVGTEVGLLTRRPQASGRSTADIELPQPRVFRPQGRSDATSTDFAVDHRRTVGRQGGLEIVTGSVGESRGRAALDVDQTDRSEIVVVPGDVDDLATIARERWVELGVTVLMGQTSGRAPAVVRPIAQIELAQSLEDDTLSIGRYLDPAQHSSVERVGCDLDRKAQRFGEVMGLANPERDLGDRAGFNVDALDSTPCPKDDRSRIGRPGHLGIDAVDGPDLLHVAVELGVDPSVLTARQVVNEEL